MPDPASFGAIIIGDEILSGKRQDRHFVQVIEALRTRGFQLSWARYLPDDRAALVAALRESFAGSDIVFCFGGIGATPDDHTRQAAAEALGRPLVRHPEAIALIEAEFGAGAYPNRVLMAEFPTGAEIIPNPVNRVAAFSVGQHHFLPGFPQMAWPMLDWLLGGKYATLSPPTQLEECSVLVYDIGESVLVPLMNEIVRAFPRVKLFSLPSMPSEGRRKLELGIRGDRTDLAPAIEAIKRGLEKLDCHYERSGTAADSR